jgi:hypothetical protein
LSQIEDPAITIERLLRSKMRVIKDDGNLLMFNVSAEWQNSDAFKSGEAQVTVGLADTVQEKIDLTGKIRRRISTLRVNIWTTDTTDRSENAKATREKIVEAITHVIQQSCSVPNISVYDFSWSSIDSQGFRAFFGDSELAPTADWTEFSAANYQNLWFSDDRRVEVSNCESGKSAVMLFGFKIESRPVVIKTISLSFEGYGSSPGGNGVTIQVWDCRQNCWHFSQTNQAAADASLTLTLTSNLPDFIDADGYIWFLVKSLDSSDGTTPAVLECDYASATITVKGITYCDVTAYRNLDRFDIKPPIYRTELSLKSYFIENIGE